MPATAQARALPLDELHRDAGCSHWSQEGGYRVPDAYGDARAEAGALGTGAVLYDASAWGRVEILGPDARRLLNGFCTIDVLALTPGELAHGLITGAKGQILADMAVAVHDDRLWLRLPPGQGRPLREHLAKYVVTEDVELLPMGDLIPLWILGPRARERLGKEGAGVPEVGRHGRYDLWGTEVQLENTGLLGLPGVCVSVSASIARDFVAELRRRLAIEWVGRRGLESVRIRAGAPRWGVDFGSGTLPQEAGLNALVNYEKGCYLGQEVIARLHYRGQVQRRLCALEVEGSGEVPAEVTAASQPVGELTSLDPLADGGPAPGIATLKRSVVDEPTALVVEQIGGATVIRSLAVNEFGVWTAASGTPVQPA